MHSFKLTPLLLLALNSMVKAADEDTTSYETTVTVTSTPQVVQTTTVPGEVLINGIVYVWTDANGQLTSTTEYETTTVPITTDAQQTSSDAETDSDSASATATTDGNESSDAAAPSSQPSVPAESSDAATSSADATAAPSSDAQESQSTASVSNSESAPTQAPTTTAPASSEATSSASSGDDAGEEEEDDDDDDDATRSLTLAPNVSSIFVNVPAGDYSTSTITTDTTLSDGRTAALELVVLYTAVCSAN